MTTTRLLTITEAAERLRLQSPANFARFARRHGIPLLRMGARVVRVRERDLEAVIGAQIASPERPAATVPGGTAT